DQCPASARGLRELLDSAKASVVRAKDVVNARVARLLEEENLMHLRQVSGGEFGLFHPRGDLSCTQAEPVFLRTEHPEPIRGGGQGKKGMQGKETAGVLTLRW